MARILVADDNRQFVDMLRATLEDAGYDVVSAYSGLGVGDLIEREQLDLLVLDVLMPGLSGDAIAERTPGIPVLLMTGDSGDQFVRSAQLPRLRKPFSEQELVEAVSGLLADPGPGQASA